MNTREELTAPYKNVADPLAERVGDSYDMAKAALERADAAELFTLYEKTVIENGKALEALALIVSHYQGSQDKPRYHPDSPNSIDAMKEVALAAIALARSVASKEEKPS